MTSPYFVHGLTNLITNVCMIKLLKIVFQPYEEDSLTVVAWYTVILHLV